VSRIKYVPAIDGLRTLAILPVVFFHLGLSWMPGGFAGVDVFFVISGYLISLIILEECHAGTFSFLNFWKRRIRRILPALR
jgi:peptidoglycan/LPS O-acetylase OafA/YrhL